MSLFKTKTWWDYRSSNEEETDLGCLCVANIDNASDNCDKVIVGSFEGFLHIYQPSQEQKAHDVLLETKLQFPILQICVGKFVSISPKLHLAILHPRKLVVYELVSLDGSVDHAKQCSLNKVYEHNLERSAANMVHGNFGGVKDCDYICVQSLDGGLMVFESERFSFIRFTTGFLLPGPLAYSSRTDSIITVSSSGCVTAYSFQVLALATDSGKKEDISKSAGKKIHTDWEFILGECAIDIKVIERELWPPVIMILGERNLFCLEDTGKISFMKKLEYKPTCFYTFAAPDGTTINTLVCTITDQVLVYNNISLKWAATCDISPVHITTGNFAGIRGIMVMLSDNCHVVCSYLGTKPSLFHLAQASRTEANYEKIQLELEDTNRKIKEAHYDKDSDLMMITHDNKEDLNIEVDVPTVLDRHSMVPHDSDMRGRGFSPPSITVCVKLIARRRINDVQVSIQVDPPLKANITHTSFSSVADNDSTSVFNVSFFMSHEFSAASLQFHITASYQQVSGIPHVTSCTGDLPLLLVATPHPPIKTLPQKITLESNKPCVNLMELFPEFESEESAQNIVGIKLIGGPVVTILTSSTSSRYRIQSETYAGLWLAMQQLVHRLKKYFNGKDFKLSCSHGVNLEELSVVIDRHYMLRQSRENVKAMLDQRAKQFRAIQKRLLIRFKDKTPTPLSCLDTLLEGTYRQILALTEAMEENGETLLMSNAELGATLQTTILVAKYWLQLNTEEVEVLRSALNPSVKQCAEGWEEVVDVAITSLLRTSLARNNKDGTNVQMSSKIFDFPIDTTKVKKHIAILFDRLSKGARLVDKIPQRSEITKHITNGGPISNISIRKSPVKEPMKIRASIDNAQSTMALHEEEEENNIYNDILSDAPLLASHTDVSSAINMSYEKLKEKTPEISDSKSILGYKMETSVPAPTYIKPVEPIIPDFTNSIVTSSSGLDDYEIESSAYYDNEDEGL